MKPQYIIIGGVNGAGKSTLYRTNPQIFGATRRLNADEKLRAAGGDWRNPADAARAGSSYIVVGRPILKAKDPVAATRAILADLKSA